ncbi:MAG: hypothetical protein SGARI_000774, partial [Bacillariaceae sp.]
MPSRHTHILSALLAVVAVANGFVLPSSNTPVVTAASVSSSTSSLRMASSSSVVVVSPPGGVGEVAAVKAACQGSSVRWFVISNQDNAASVALAPQALQDIADASGSLDLAGATVEDLKSGGEELSAVSQWCGKADGLICTYDGAGDLQDFQAALRLAAQEASGGISGPQIAVLAAEQDLTGKDDDDEDGGAGFLSGLFRNSPPVPSSLPKSFAGRGNVCVVRHGQLFGIPESSPDFSPLVGGPRRTPEITEEYTMRSVRVDPFVFSGNVMGSSSMKTCRHCVGEAAALFVTGKLPILSQPISVSSLGGTEEWALDQWQEELSRVEELVASGKASTLFSQEMIVDDTERLADWLCSKWAPAVMRTYDLAAIRTGARPVYASRAGDGLVEITWQELVNFDSVTVGKMILQVTNDGISATRGSGDASKGYGSVSMLPLPGEDVLVRRLAEAASQAIDKGLAKKPKAKKPAKIVVEAPKPTTTLQSAGTVETTAKSPSKEPATTAPKTGPRQAGARRSTPRS